MIDSERLAREFVTLCEIASPSGREGRVATYLKKVCAELGGEVLEDDSATHTGADCGNLLVRFAAGGLDLEPVFFNCHMDTVGPADEVRPRRRGDIFTSQGDTVLGGDDKSGIAVLIETMRTIREKGLPHGPMEFLFTTSEEIGLLGAKAFDTGRLRARLGYALDTTGTGKVIIAAPAANRITAIIQGVAAHAGLHPEEGISAIHLAARAIAGLQLGRLDPETTANIGRIEGGTAINIVPERVVVRGEVRSHDVAKLAVRTKAIEDGFRQAVETWRDPSGRVPGRPSLSFAVEEEFPLMRLTMDEPVIQRVRRAGERIGLGLEYIMAGGGSDANIFNGKGVRTAILSTGMDKVHTTEERIDLRDMTRTAELVLALCTG